MVADAQESQREFLKLNAVLGATRGAVGLTADAIADFAGARQLVTDFGDEATVQAAAVLASFESIRGDAFLKTLELAQDMSSVMGGDLTNSVKQLGKALADPAAGMAKLSKIGIVFDEGTKAQIKSMVELGNTAGAQGVILDKLAGKFGGAAEAMASPAVRLKNQLGELSEAGGRVLLPTFELLTGAMAEFTKSQVDAADGAQELGDSIASNIVPVFGVAADAANALSGSFDALQAGFARLTNFKAAGVTLGARITDAVGLTSSATDFANNLSEELDRTAAREMESAGKKLGETFSGAFTRQLEEVRANIEAARNRSREFSELGANIAKIREPVEAMRPKLPEVKPPAVPRWVERTAEDLFDSMTAGISKWWDGPKARDIEVPDIDVPTDPGGVSAMTRGSSEAFTAIQAAIRAGNNQPINQVANNTKLTTEELKRLNIAVAGIAASPVPIFGL